MDDELHVGGHLKGGLKERASRSEKWPFIILQNRPLGRFLAATVQARTPVRATLAHRQAGQRGGRGMRQRNPALPPSPSMPTPLSSGNLDNLDVPATSPSPKFRSPGGDKSKTDLRGIVESLRCTLRYAYDTPATITARSRHTNPHPTAKAPALSPRAHACDVIIASLPSRWFSRGVP